jgi:hypothetical protein
VWEEGWKYLSKYWPMRSPTACAFWVAARLAYNVERFMLVSGSSSRKEEAPVAAPLDRPILVLKISYEPK